MGVLAMPERDYGLADLALRRGQIEGGRLRDLATLQSNSRQNMAQIAARSDLARGERSSDLIKTLALIGTKAVGDWQDQKQNEVVNAQKQQALQMQREREDRQDALAFAKEDREQAKFAQGQERLAKEKNRDMVLAEAYKVSKGPDGQLRRDVFSNMLTNLGLGPAIPDIFKSIDEAEKSNLEVQTASARAKEAQLKYGQSAAQQIVAVNFDPVITNGILEMVSSHGNEDIVERLRQLPPDQFKVAVTNIAQGAPSRGEQLAEKKYQDEFPARPDAKTGLTPQQAAQNELERQRIAKMGLTQGTTAADHKDNIVLTMDGIVSGRIPPELPSRGTNAYTELAAEAERRKFDLAKANQDWLATKKFLATLNGAQQTRLRQAVEFTDETVKGMTGLIDEWEGGKFPLLNKLDLMAARNGLYGQQAASIATRLTTQIADIQSELGTVYKGGNSSTDESLRLAAENLKANWSWQVMKDSVDQIQKNLQYRRNSMKSVGAAGVSEPNPYPTGRQEGAAPATGAPTAADLIKKYGGG